MYSVGSLIVYGGTGVCQVEAIEEKAQGGEIRQYYRLKPLYQSGTISVPVDGKVFMRPVISREEAEALIDAMPAMPAQDFHERNFTQLAAHYQQLLCSHECADIAGFLVSIQEAQRREPGPPLRPGGRQVHEAGRDPAIRRVLRRSRHPLRRGGACDSRKNERPPVRRSFFVAAR